MNAPAKPERTLIAGEVFLRALAEHGVDYFFANPGTDFPPIVEAFARARTSNAKLPKPVLVPHENIAVAMAHGAYAMTGRPQAVMVHVNVGTGNTINNLINLSRDRVPLILAAGRTPITEKGSFGSRSRQIHWARRCSTRPAWCARWSSGITSCARPARPPTWWRAPMRWR